MLNQLKKIFPSLINYTPDDYELKKGFQWFKTTDNKIIGIHKDELTAKENDILSTFLKPYHPSFPIQTKKEKKWAQLIKNNKQPFKNGHISFRFVYFNIPIKQIEPASFKEAIHSLFEEDISILWENEREGIIIEDFNQTDDAIYYKQIIDILMSDLYVKINFLVGSFQSDTDDLQFYYKNMIHGGQIVFKYSDKNVITYFEAIPYIIMHQIDFQFKNNLSHHILKEFSGDKEFFKMIDVFFQSNLNISVTAKKLYMHRNSLQYRIDRFKERTGIDIRNFHQAMTVYLALIAFQENNV